MQAAEGIAKVVVAGRTQQFLTDARIKRELARRAEQVQGYRLVQLRGFGEKQVRRSRRPGSRARRSGPR